MNKSQVNYLLGLVIKILTDIYIMYYPYLDKVSQTELSSSIGFLKRIYTVTEELPF